MIIEERLSETRVRHYSDLNVMIRQVETGRLYEDAVDRMPCKYTYEETEEPIEPEEQDDADSEPQE